METIPKSRNTKVGFIQKPHGINGELVIRFQEQFYDTLEGVKTIFLDIENLLVPFFIEDDGLRFRTGESAIIKLEWIDNEEQARDLAGCSVFVDSELLKSNDSFFDVFMLKGFLLIDQRKNQIGTITSISNFSGNIILELVYLNKEIMIPFNEDFLIHFDPDNQIIALNLPDGLLNLDSEDF